MPAPPLSSGCFAILPDEPSADGTSRPLALFQTLEDAIEWGSKRYQGGAFRIRFVQFVPVEGATSQSLAS